MSEYIIKSEQLEELNKAHGGMQIVTSWLSAYAIFDTSEFPPQMKSKHLAITLPEVVRCRDCRFCGSGMWGGETFPVCKRGIHIFQVAKDGFCAWGERKEANYERQDN